MIKQASNHAGGDVEPSCTDSSDQPMSAARFGNAMNEALRMMDLEGRPVPASPPRGVRMADMRAMEAHVERRRRLATRIRAESTSRTEEEIEARLEQFGA